MNSLFVLLFSGLKLAKFSKVFLSGLTIFLSIWIYAKSYGWPFAVGFIGLIFLHEMGHYLAAKQKNLAVGLPMFIPFVGAWIELKEEPVNAEVEAYVAYAGPFVGTLAAFAFYYYGLVNDHKLALALAQAGFMINLFNLIPISPLDGGRITAVISPRVWLIGVPVLVWLWMSNPSPMLIFIAVLALPQVIKAWQYNPTLPEYQSYYGVKNSVRFEYALLYLTLVIVLAMMIQHKPV